MRQASALAQSGRRGEAEAKIQEAQGTLRKAVKSYGTNVAFEKDLDEAQAFEGAVAAPAATADTTNAASKRIHAFSNSAR